jgi:hypothetical protein
MIREDLAVAPRADWLEVAAVSVSEFPAAPGARAANSSPKLTRAERVILGVLEHRMNGKAFAFPSQRLLVKDADYSPRAVKGAIAGLKRKGLLVVKRVADLTEAERSLVARSSSLALRNWRNNVYFRFDVGDGVRGRDCPGSGALAAPDASLLDLNDQDRNDHHHGGSDLREGVPERRLMVVQDPIVETECQQIVERWPTKLRSGFDARLAVLALRRRFGEGMSVQDAIDAIEGAELDADRLLREAKTTPFALVFGRCDAWRRFAEGAHRSRTARLKRASDERERRAADRDLERDVLSPTESAAAAKALLDVLARPRREGPRSTDEGTRTPRPPSLPDAGAPDDDRRERRERDTSRAVHSVRDAFRENAGFRGRVPVGCGPEYRAHDGEGDDKPRHQLHDGRQPEGCGSEDSCSLPRAADGENDRPDRDPHETETNGAEHEVNARRGDGRHPAEATSVLPAALAPRDRDPYSSPLELLSDTLERPGLLLGRLERRAWATDSSTS